MAKIKSITYTVEDFIDWRRRFETREKIKLRKFIQLINTCVKEKQYLYVHYEGRFGGGKTLLTISEVIPNIEGDVLFVTNLRKLRDYVAEKLKENVRKKHVIIFYAKDEICREIEKMYENNVDEFTILLRCLTCENRTTCEFYCKIREIMNSRNVIVVTTHVLGDLLCLVKSFPIVVIDEVDQLPYTFGKKIPIKVIEELKKSNNSILKEIARRVERLSIKIGSYLIRKPPIYTRSIVKYGISATYPPEIDIALLYLLFNRVEIPEYEIYKGPNVIKYFIKITNCTLFDQVFIHRDFLLMKDVDKWYQILFKIIEKSVEYVKPIGLISRNYQLTERLFYNLQSLGYKVIADKFAKPSDLKNENYEIYILTTHGKFYRGISLPDCKLIIATYQAYVKNEVNTHLGILNTIYLTLHEHFIEDKFDEYLYNIDVIEQYASNLQAVYRFNRNPINNHVMLLMDKNFEIAIKYLFMRYKSWFRTEYENNRIMIKIDNLFDLSKIEKILNQLNQ